MNVLVTAFAIFATIGFLYRANVKKSKRIEGLEKECEQLHKMLVKYGKENTEETKG